MAEEDSELDRPLMLFGRDVRKVPCFRNSILYSVGWGVGTGLAVFMFTSKPQLASHATMGTFACVALGYWTYCRLDWAEQRFSSGQIFGAYRDILAEKNDRGKANQVEVSEV